MKNSNFKKILCLLSFAVVPALLFSSVNESNATIKPHQRIGSDEITGVETDPKQYVGYGYNVISGKALYEADALMLNNPILDVENPALQNKIKVFDGSKTEYQSDTSNSVRTISKNYGKVLSGGGGIGGGIASFQVDINAKFNRSKAESWTGVASEEYSYYTIFAGNRPVILQMDYDQMVDYLNPNFKKDILACKQKYDANNLFKKYGTHLLTGYTLGGIFEMTNYYATNSNNYVKEGETSFDAQVNLALGSYAHGDGDFSFTNNFGYLDNNKYATNSYKCTTYGGLAFPGLTIDQAFSWYETMTGAGYLYQLWTDSINAGRNLVIVNIPQSSKMVPLWDLLPNTEEYATAKFEMMTEYQNLTKGKYLDYKAKYPDRFKKNVGNDHIVEENFDYVDYGFNYSTKDGNKYVTSYIPGDSVVTTEAYKTKENSYIYMDYDQTKYAGQSAKWTISGSNCVEVIDPTNGIFKINELPLTESSTESGDMVKLPQQFTANFTVNGIKLFQRKFLISSSSFSGGSGTEESPYLISTPQEFEVFAENKKYWESNLYFKLINNIDLTGLNIDDVGDEATDARFKGVFDGNNYRISGFENKNPNATSYGLFYANLGTIKNLRIDYKNQPIVIGDNIERVGLVASKNNYPGRIINCTVENVDMTYQRTQSALNFTLRIGGITGYNTGTIEECNVDNIKINVDLKKRIKQTEIGGITGGSKAMDSGSNRPIINKCLVKGLSIKFDASETVDETFSFFGGIVGAATATDISDCLVTDLSKNSDGYHFSYKLNADPQNALASGGIAGRLVTGSTITNAIVYNSVHMQDVTKKTNHDETYHLCSALIAGYADVTASESKAKIINSYAMHANDEDNIVNSLAKKDMVSAGFDILVNKRFVKGDFKGDISSDDTKWLFNGDVPVLNLIRVNESTLAVDVSKTKTTFYEGESFSYSNISVKGLLSDGSEISESSVIVDDSNFYDGEDGKASIGSHEIIVYCFGAVLSYNVEVIPQVTDHIYVTGVKDTTYFTKETNFDTSSIEVHRVTKNGLDEIISYDETGKNGYTYSIPTGEFVAGNNAIEIEYDGATYKYNVDAEERTVKEIKVTNKDVLAAKEFKVGSDQLDLSEAEGTIYYENGTTGKLDGKDCDFIYPRIKQGKNRVIITYDVAYQDDFTVVGVEEDLTIALVSEFIAAVNDIDSAHTMAERFNAITKANNIYKQIGDKYVGDETYENAKAKLAELIETYNADANDINDGYDNAIKASDSLGISIGTAAGFSIIALLVSLLLKRL